ncbi:glyoxylase-like metal-dependent hydrolase (beta-lactamase superfamily II) [Azospirillum agricola]|uniref:MBL fold metallo-hydrolase n=1 Tax=Azospirillum agricola TaxID=1720247 RepID=UPI001AE7C1AA|nr:MBL fold metallo-hydrolase [Azospirillum agricola]MBP2231452.1 glyoxylase-like metal-dependent hydrolase (beta-lactamase superfamily II) [Azospirillum agricola]
MQYVIVPVTPFQQNCTVFWCPETMKGAAVDPGGDLPLILRAAESKGVTLEKILVTHGHIDHAGGVADLADDLSLPIEGPHPDDLFWIEGMPQQSKMFGFPPVRSFTPGRWLADGETVTVGTLTLEVRHCPGHTPGHVVFIHRPSKLAIVGDVLFQGSVGRTDFPRGNHGDLIASIKEKLLPYGDDIAFIPGHGPMSTFGEERLYNPFLTD